MKQSNLYHVKPILLLFLSFAMVALFDSCKRAAEKASEKMVEKSIGDDAKVNIDDEKITVKTDEGTFTSDASAHSWPKQIPDDVPEFKAGKVVSVTAQEMEDTNNWMVIFDEVSEGALEKYKETLMDKGFKINYITMAGSGGHLAAEKGNLAVVAMVGEGNATVTVSTND